MDPTSFQTALLDWYDSSKRILPWRDNPNPYHVWVSEIMLQQTRVEAVIPYFHRFIAELPTIADLATVDDDKLNKLWEGLGYYSRVRNLKKAAQQVIDDFDGVLPSNRTDLESLSGIGPYTAGAIRSIAFNQQDTAVDGNVLRVFARLTANQNDIKSPPVKREIRRLVASLLPEERVGDFNQALMEIGATVCLPNGKPLCMVCPLNSFCKAFQQGLTDTIPKKQKKTKRRIEKRTVLLLEHNGKFAIRQRPVDGLLGGLYEFPNVLGHLTKADVLKQYPDSTISKLPKAKHVFSHLEWHMIGYHVLLDEQIEQFPFVSPEELYATYSVPTAFKTYKEALLSLN